LKAPSFQTFGGLSSQEGFSFKSSGWPSSSSSSSFSSPASSSLQANSPQQQGRDIFNPFFSSLVPFESSSYPSAPPGIPPANPPEFPSLYGDGKGGGGGEGGPHSFFSASSSPMSNSEIPAHLLDPVPTESQGFFSFFLNTCSLSNLEVF